MIVIFSSHMYHGIVIELYLVEMQFPSKCTQPWLVAASHLRTSRNNKIQLMVTIEKALRIKDETERLLTKDEDIKNRWLEYFNKLFNEDSGSSFIELDVSSDDLNKQFVRRI
jgi:hypothetical protein